LNITLPSSGCRKPEITLISVVLPAPLGPIIASISPSFSSKETSFKATNPPNLFVTFCILSILSPCSFEVDGEPALVGRTGSPENLII
jgi:hypothetical protein